jgi:hypothetical protein
MGSLAQPTPLGVAVGACVVLAVALVVVVTAVVRRRRAGHRDRELLHTELARSRARVDSLSQRVEELAVEVVEARRSAQEAVDREYVITSLAGAEKDGEKSGGKQHVPVAIGRLLEPPPPAGKRAEERLLHVLARRRGASPRGARAVDVVVRTVALGHGVRRALAPDVLDRAAAEANVARRRSRRLRKREVREARRLLRAVRAHRGAGEDAA